MSGPYVPDKIEEAEMWYIGVARGGCHERRTECRRAGVSVYRYTSVLLHPRSCVPMYRCTSVLVYRYTRVLVYLCTGVPVYRYAAVPVYQCIGLPVYLCVPVYLCTCALVQNMTERERG